MQEVHPDSIGHNDPAAAERFQQISHVWAAQTYRDPRHPATVRVEDDMKNDATFEVGQHSHDSLRTGV